MRNVAGDQQGLALQQHFPCKFPYSFKTSDCHKISSFYDGGLKFGHFDILDMLFPLAAKGLFNKTSKLQIIYGDQSSDPSKAVIHKDQQSRPPVSCVNCNDS